MDPSFSTHDPPPSEGDSATAPATAPIAGLSPARVRELQEQLGARTPAELRAAAEDGRLRELRGVGPKTEERILAALGSSSAPASRGGPSPAAERSRPAPEPAYRPPERSDAAPQPRAPSPAPTRSDRDGGGRVEEERPRADRAEVEPSETGSAGRTRARRGPGIRRFVSDVLLLAGILMLLDAGLTVVWQEPLSALYTSRSQGRLSDERAERNRAERRLEDRARPRRVARAPQDRRSVRRAKRAARRVQANYRIARAVELNQSTEAGEAIGRVEIDKIGVDFVFTQGTDEDSLRLGPAHYQETALPGEGATVGIAGHRTTYSAPFRHVDELEKGDEITVDVPYGHFRYAVERTKIVPPDALSVLQDVDHERLVLTACHPLYSAAQRIVVFAHLQQAAAVAPAEAEERQVGGGSGANPFDQDGGPEGIGLILVLAGLPAGAIGVLASLIALAAAPPAQRGNYVLTLICSLFAVALFALVLLGAIG